MKSLQYLFIFLLLLANACGISEAEGQSENKSTHEINEKEVLSSSIEEVPNDVKVQPDLEQELTFGQKLAAAGESIEDRSIVYDPSYVSLEYPGGDVDPKTGVCTDVIIRAYRVLDIDLQKELHEDILKSKSAYSRVDRIDKNIDHRRVPNLAVFFTRHGKKLEVTDNPDDYQPGDIIWWELGGPGGIDHIGIVVNKKTADGSRHLMVHNVGGGQAVEDFMFNAHIKGHYSYEP